MALFFWISGITCLENGVGLHRGSMRSRVSLCALLTAAVTAIGLSAVVVPAASAAEPAPPQPFQRSDGRWGFVNSDHCWKIQPLYNYAWPFSEGLALVSLGSKTGFIDKSGSMLITLPFQGAGSFSEGLAWVESQGKTGFIDKTGRLVISLEFETAYRPFRGLHHPTTF